MTNAHWTIDGGAVAQRLGLAQGLLLNDFEAQALSLPVIRDEWTTTIGGPFQKSAGAKLILGPGTGLGVSALLEIQGKHFALATEAGHMDFGPLGGEEAAIWPHLPLAPLGRVSGEFLISGPGLVRLHHARLASQSKVAAADLDERRIVDDGLADPASEEAQTIKMFWSLAARFAGDLALAFLAKGGVTFAGGVLPRLTGLVDPVVFRAHFENKEPFVDVMGQIQTRLIVAEDTVIAGMAAIAARPSDYALDYGRRAWR
jgi:glucokinase